MKEGNHLNHPVHLTGIEHPPLKKTSTEVGANPIPSVLQDKVFLNYDLPAELLIASLVGAVIWVRSRR